MILDLRVLVSRLNRAFIMQHNAVRRRPTNKSGHGAERSMSKQGYRLSLYTDTESN